MCNQTNMFSYIVLVSAVVVLLVQFSGGQVLQFGTCARVETKKYFDLERFMGFWYEIERFPAWYEQYGRCAFKHIQYCGRRVEIEHGFVRDEIKYILHLNSTYKPGDEAVFNVQETNIDPVGIPLAVISTDYTQYAVVHGCKHNEELGIKYISAWILSRESTLPDVVLMKAYGELNAIPYANLAYLEKVDQGDSSCHHRWTAHVRAENITDLNSGLYPYE